MKSIFGSILLMFLLFYYALLKKLFVADSAVNMNEASRFLHNSDIYLSIHRISIKNTATFVLNTAKT